MLFKSFCVCSWWVLSLNWHANWVRIFTRRAHQNTTSSENSQNKAFCLLKASLPLCGNSPCVDLQYCGGMLRLSIAFRCDRGMVSFSADVNPFLPALFVFLTGCLVSLLRTSHSSVGAVLWDVTKVFNLRIVASNAGMLWEGWWWVGYAKWGQKQ